MLRESRRGAVIDGSGARSSTRSCRRSARHTSEMERRADDAERELLQWKKVRFMADKVGDEFEGYITGRRAVRTVHRADRALRRRAGPRLEHGATTTTGSSSSSTCSAARTRRRSTGSATRCGCRSCALTWSAGRSISDWWTFSRRCGGTNAPAGRFAARRQTEDRAPEGAASGSTRTDRRRRRRRGTRSAQVAMTSRLPCRLP